MRIVTSFAAAFCLLSFAFAPVASAAGNQTAKAMAPSGEKVLVVDEGDYLRASSTSVHANLSMLTGSAVKPNLSGLAGSDIYDNDGKKLGTIKEFAAGSDGTVYAIIDESTNPLVKIRSAFGDEVVLLVPTGKIRHSARPGKNGS